LERKRGKKERKVGEEKSCHLGVGFKSQGKKAVDTIAFVGKLT